MSSEFRVKKCEASVFKPGTHNSELGTKIRTSGSDLLLALQRKNITASRLIAAPQGGEESPGNAEHPTS